MAAPLPEYRRQALVQRRQELLAEHTAATRQLGQMLDETGRLRVQRQIDDLEQQIGEIDRQLEDGAAPDPAQEAPPAVQPPLPPKAPPAAEGGRLGRWFGQLSDPIKAALIGGLFVVIAALIALADALVPAPSPDIAGPTRAPVTFTVRVEDGGGNRIQDARVTLELPGRAPLSAYTDSEGLAAIVVPAPFADGPASIVVVADGFATYRQNIQVDGGMLPTLVRLAATTQP